MGTRERYPAGTFSWADLTTPNQSASKEFYVSLFDWDGEDIPVGDGAYYSMMRVGPDNVAAIAPLPPATVTAETRAKWNSYVTVQSADESLARAAELGATPLGDAFDVMDAGRIGAIHDPHGAHLLMWEPKRNPGAGAVNGDGMLTWNELQSPDPDASAEFYGALFGWTTSRGHRGDRDYLVIETPEGRSGGGIIESEPGWSTAWLTYFGAHRLDAMVSLATERGARLLTAPTTVEDGTIAILLDPQGAMFALYSGEFDD